MEFVWRDVGKDEEAEVVALFRGEDMRFADVQGSFCDFCRYWQDEIGEDFFVKTIYLGDVLVAAIAFSRSVDGVYTFLEFVVVPQHREKWLGSKILTEFVRSSKLIVGEEISQAVAVIEWDNYRAQGAFARAGFVNSGTHPDGDAVCFSYKMMP